MYVIYYFTHLHIITWFLDINRKILLLGWKLKMRCTFCVKWFRIFSGQVVLEQFKICYWYPLWYHCIFLDLSVFLFCSLHFPHNNAYLLCYFIICLTQLTHFYLPDLTAIRTWGSIFQSSLWISDVTLNKRLLKSEIHIWIKGILCVCVHRSAFFSLRDNSKYRKWDENWIFHNGYFILTKYFILFILLLSARKKKMLNMLSQGDIPVLH